MRLIDADALKDTLLKHRYTTEHNQIFRYIDEQPTAYDIDKVVEELEERKEEREKQYKMASMEDGSYMLSKCFSEGARAYCKAIEIVKHGGVGIETETIRDKAIKWNTNSSKRVPYEFIDYVEGKRDIGVSDDVCEWKYASDGEFIQNPHTKRLYSNETSMQNVYCNTCGKKIRIVGD